MPANTSSETLDTAKIQLNNQSYALSVLLLVFCTLTDSELSKIGLEPFFPPVKKRFSQTLTRVRLPKKAPVVLSLRVPTTY